MSQNQQLLADLGGFGTDPFAAVGALQQPQQQQPQQQQQKLLQQPPSAPVPSVGISQKQNPPSQDSFANFDTATFDAFPSAGKRIYCILLYVHVPGMHTLCF